VEKIVRDVWKETPSACGYKTTGGRRDRGKKKLSRSRAGLEGTAQKSVVGGKRGES